MPDAGCRMPDARCRMPDAGCRMPDARCQMPDARCQMPDVRCQMPDAGCRMPDARCQMPDARCRMPGDAAPGARTCAICHMSSCHLPFVICHSVILPFCHSAIPFSAAMPQRVTHSAPASTRHSPHRATIPSGLVLRLLRPYTSARLASPFGAVSCREGRPIMDRHSRAGWWWLVAGATRRGAGSPGKSPTRLSGGQLAARGRGFRSAGRHRDECDPG